IEEAPSSITNYELRRTIWDAAITIARKIGYVNAGTVEFLVDRDGKFYFLEMNTRIQVEHPVTEFITGLDMVELQIGIASGKPLPYRQEDIRQNGHAIECRIYAEDAGNNFLPSPGPVWQYHEPEGPGIRVDSSISGKTSIGSEFDPMIAKLVCHGESRGEARLKAVAALGEFIAAGCTTNIEFLRGTLMHPAFIENEISTSFCEQHRKEILDELHRQKKEYPAEDVLAAFLLADFNVCYGKNIWCSVGYWRDIMQLGVRIEEAGMIIPIAFSSRKLIRFRYRGKEFEAVLHKLTDGRAEFSINGQYHTAFVSYEDPGLAWVTMNGIHFTVERKDRLHSEILADTPEHANAGEDQVTAPMFGKLTQILVKENEPVKKGQVLAIVEAMKMENLITARKDARVEKIYLNAGQTVETNSIILKYHT
ncbi:MAG TPA: biotin/lipoyl-containing protein, partial [Bacteroidales bacterium]|nr:biotin/lipoyl-containing protein [Bacteroidales bacterium]